MRQKATVYAMFEAPTQTTAGLWCVWDGYVMYLWLSAYHWAVPPSVIQSRQRLQDIKGNKSYLVKAIPTLPPSLWWLDYLRKDDSQVKFGTFWEYVYYYRCVTTSKSNYGCVPLVFLLVAQRVHCCFELQSHNCSSKVSHPLVGDNFLLWNTNIIKNICIT